VQQYKMTFNLLMLITKTLLDGSMEVCLRIVLISCRTGLRDLWLLWFNANKLFALRSLYWWMPYFSALTYILINDNSNKLLSIPSISEQIQGIRQLKQLESLNMLDTRHFILKHTTVYNTTKKISSWPSRRST
jgi:hypothetical protein